MKLSIIGFTDAKGCDNCGKEANVFHVRCEVGTLDADLCIKCLARQCRMRAKAQQTDISNCSAVKSGVA